MIHRVLFTLLISGITVGQVQKALAEERGHHASMAIVKPTLGNTLLWRSIYRHDDRYFVDAIRANPFGDIRLYPGQSIAAFPSTNVDALPETYAPYWEDISRFSRLSSGYLVLHPKDSNVIGDIRYAMLPTSTEPLWGIRLDLESPGTGIEEATFRQLNDDDRQQFIEMLFGK